ncbi:hypothetical protein SAMN05421640_1632 [Ekhidna lutea]|uniref:Uncharacterized protein n=1 Tax=Ekhidna lutea TaxID=447679 RepID=A0A239IER5_EKHLU|nr:hypothetical protein [Ekhidna lutea]SNS92041.1 hypothetical protein SAMN05421640_1632 [Ekhidna lutea]
MEKKSKKVNEKEEEKPTENHEENDHGGFPEDLDFSKNLGCGG